MPDVFILGAGFSKAIHSSMPDLTELRDRVRKICESGGDKLPPPLSDLDNIELWLTYLSQSQPWVKEHRNLENKALFLRMTEIIGQVLNETTGAVVSKDCPEWLRSLIKWWDKNNSNVITLNYDTLIERAAGNNQISTKDIYPVSFTDIMTRRALLPNGDRKDSFQLFKLHGSINWYYSGASSFQGEVLYNTYVTPWGDNLDWEKHSISEASDKTPLLVPPTSEKTTYFKHETLRQIWLKASAALSSATRIYCIGYSLPATDLGIRFFMQHSRPNEKVSMFIVNTNNKVVDHYQELLRNSYNIDGKYADGGIQALIRDLPEVLDI